MDSGSQFAQRQGERQSGSGWSWKGDLVEGRVQRVSGMETKGGCCYGGCQRAAENLILDGSS